MRFLTARPTDFFHSGRLRKLAGRGRAGFPPLSTKILFDGVFCGDYSLAIVNRLLAAQLVAKSYQLQLYSPEPEVRNDRFLRDEPELIRRFVKEVPERGTVDIHLRNTWPPVTEDMVGRWNVYVGFAWEETEFPPELVARFNRDLNLVLVTSNFVREALLGSGISIPVEVIGNGTDHFRPRQNAVCPLAASGRTRFLHVSSCFPRKGADVLIEAFAGAFTASDSVELIIKTFDNPHNQIGALVDAARTSFPNAAPIQTIFGSYSNTEMIGLIQSAAALVAPSRGEGFGLPLAEAMQLGIPVITTGFGGQRDFCNDETAWIIDYDLTPSGSHVKGMYSLWAEPSVEALRALMKAVLERPDEARRRCDNARTLLQRQFKWNDVAERVLVQLGQLTTGHRKASGARMPLVDVVSTWQDACGIAEYSGHLFGNPNLNCRLNRVFSRRKVGSPGQDVEAAAPGEERTAEASVERIWGYDSAGVITLGQRLESARGAELLWFQHHPGFFAPGDMEMLAEALKNSRYKSKFITLHNVADVINHDTWWIDGFDLVFVHRAEDAGLLSERGVRHVHVVPHGIPRVLEHPKDDEVEEFTIGTFGFLVAHKNLSNLIAALKIARDYVPRLRVKCLTSVLDNRNSAETAAKLMLLMRFHDVTDMVDLDPSFRDENYILQELGSCQLLAFVYGDSTESATGAARLALSANRPLLCSRSNVLADLHEFSHVVRDTEPRTLAEAIISLAASREFRHLYDSERRAYADQYSWDSVSMRYNHHIASQLARH